MASKRIKKKQAKKKQQAYILKESGYNQKQISRLSESQLNKEYTRILTENKRKEQRKTNQKNARQSRISQKRFKLEALGFTKAMERGAISDRKIDSIKLSDLERGNINRENYPFLFGIDSFDFDKIYTVKNGERLFFAFQDWTNEMPSFEELIQNFLQYSPQELIDFLDGAIHMPKTGKKGVAGSSSGKAGTYRFEAGSQQILSTFSLETYNYNRRKPKRKKKSKDSHTLNYKAPFQILKDGHRNSFDQVTTRNLLAVANAIMYNVTELDRSAFYEKFYPVVNRLLPEIGAILPKP